MNNMDIHDDLLIIYMLGEASTEEQIRVKKKLDADLDLKLRYETFKKVWEASRHLAPEELPDRDAAFRRYKTKAAAREKAKLRTLKGRLIGKWISVAATILLVAGGIWFYKIRKADDIHLVTRNETRQDSLPDGSVVTLNRLSRFSYPSHFSGKQRIVKLDAGEVFFNVAKDRSKPFLIKAGNFSIKVLGTSFNVKYKTNNFEVIVESGVVTVTDQLGSVTLHPGEKLSAGPEKPYLKKGKNRDQLYRWYRDRRFVANDTPLWRMVEVLNEAYDAHIVIGRKELNDLPLNTTFENNSLDDVLDVISRTFKLKIEKNKDTILLK